MLASQTNYVILSSVPNTGTQQMKGFQKEPTHFFDEIKNTVIISSKS